MKNILQNIAISWYQSIDATGFIYTVVKSLNKYIRYLIYVSFPISLYFLLLFLGSIIDLNSYYDSNPLFANIANLLGWFTLYFSTFFASFIFTYETILNIDINKKIKEKKDLKTFKKVNKLQWWRLRNMNRFTRILFYIILYFILVEYLKILSFSAFANSSTTAKDFLIDFQIMIQYFTVGYLLSCLLIDYFANKNRVKL